MADKLDLTKPVQTRDGRPVRILATDARRGNDRHVVGLIDNNGFNDVVCVWGQDGMVYSAKIDDAVCGLINVPPKPVKYYAHVYRRPNGCVWIGNCGADDGKRVPPSCDGRSEFVKTIEFEA
jgi:hypothetical protein